MHLSTLETKGLCLQARWMRVLACIVFAMLLGIPQTSAAECDEALCSTGTQQTLKVDKSPSTGFSAQFVTTKAPTAAVRVTNSNARGAVALEGGSPNGTGVVGTGGMIGVDGRGVSTGAIGVRGTSDTGDGVAGKSTQSSGVHGQSTSANGVFGESSSAAASGVYGENLARGYGVAGRTHGRGTAVYGESVTANTSSSTESGIGVYGVTTSFGTGVLGEAWSDARPGTGGPGIGVKGRAGVEGIAVLGEATDRTFPPSGEGVRGLAGKFLGPVVIEGPLNVTGVAAFQGGATVSGTLTKPAGTFLIDDPSDPEHKYLSHSFVESPDMKNIYDGVVSLDSEGRATVDMPSWFDALNTDFRYQLTAIGAPAALYIAKEISHGHFEIAGGTAGLRVSWQVTGVRKDPYALQHPVQVERQKTAEEQGRYLYPQEHGKPKSLAIESPAFLSEDPTSPQNLTCERTP